MPPTSGLSVSALKLSVCCVDRDEKPVDLQLPQESSTCEVKTLTVTNEPKIKFREKKVTSLTAAGGTGAGTISFRKSKFGVNRSIRSTDSSEDG